MRNFGDVFSSSGSEQIPVQKNHLFTALTCRCPAIAQMARKGATVPVLTPLAWIFRCAISSIQE